MKKILTILLAMTLVISMFAGCDKSPDPSKETAAGGSQTPGTLPKPQDVSTPTEAASTDSYASLVSLRQAMVETPQLFAVAYFGYHDTIDSDAPVDPYEVMQAYAPQLCRDLPFLLDIPADRVIGENGDLFCIVPLDEDAIVAVSRGNWDEKSEQYLYDESIYFSKSGEPILLFCNNAGWEPDTQISISGPSGDVIWYPMLDDNLCAMPLRNDNWDSLFYDFSPYREMLAADYNNMVGEWITPTAEMLNGTTWVWNGYRKDGLEVSYQVTFGDGTLSVRWNDGFDEEDHTYPDAPWELTYDEGLAILAIDFQEFAGVLRYNLMYHEDFEVLYVGMDVAQAELPIGWEPLYRFLAPPPVSEPVEMLGQWELAWTEVEGDRNEAEPGSEIVTVFMNDDSSMRLTLEDSNFPENSFYNKALTFYEEELYYGCENDLWMASVDYLGNWDSTYSVTLLPDDTLLIRIYWEIDGGIPMVAHKAYCRIG